MHTKFGDVRSNGFYPSAFRAEGVLSLPASVRLSVCPSVNLACPRVKSKTVTRNVTKFGMHVFPTKFSAPIDCG